MRSNILSHEPAHTLNKVHAIILHEERQKMVALSHENSTPNAAVFLNKLTRNKAEMLGSSGSSGYGGQIGGTWDSKKEKGKGGFVRKRIGETMAEQQRMGLGSGQFDGLQAYQAQIGKSSLGPNQMVRLQAHQALSGQPRSGLNRLSQLSDIAFQRLLDFLGPDDDNMHPVSGPHHEEDDWNG
ncbi:hypothetical protein CRG98_032861 [Punica granatum]|uniref:Uncharacterized protein n=1 Tax=Punica granatum TaxID=22663 RepID=A0A2I0IRV5_PUNGR|nr:hypothetical protein CRG98_032861 [Punica granatum]